MTPLKQPIVVTIETVENAVSYLLAEDFLQGSKLEPRHKSINRGANSCEISNQVESGLVAQGIDYRTWEPPQPLKVGQYEVEALEGGAIKVGCQTVSRTTLEAILKLSSEAMGKAEPEWPKFTKSRDGDILEFHQDHSKSIWYCTDGSSDSIYIYDDYREAIQAGHQLITPAQAREILEAKG